MKKFHTTLSRIAATAAIVLAAASLPVSCVDNDFRLEDVSGEITVGQGDVTIPLGFLATKTLGEIIGSGVDELTVDGQGNYSISYSGGDSFSIDGIKTYFVLERTESSTKLDYPDMSIGDLTTSIDKSFSLTVPAALQSITRLPAQIAANIADSGEFDCAVELSIPKQIKSVDNIRLAGPTGSRFDITLSLNGLAAINGGGTAKVAITAPDGYELLDGEGNAVAGNTCTVTKTLADGAHEQTFPIYLRTIDTSKSEVVGGKLKIDDKLRYSISYDFTAKSGITFDPKKLPSLSIKSALVYGNAVVTLNEFSIDDRMHSFNERLTVDNIAKEVTSISEVAFKDTWLTFRIEGLNGINSHIAEATIIELSMPEKFLIDPNSVLDYDPQTNSVRSTLARLRYGWGFRLIGLRLDEADRKPADGHLELDFTVNAKIFSIPEGRVFYASDLLVNNTNLTLGFVMDKTTVRIDSITGNVDYRRTESSSINLGEIADYDIAVENFDVSPTITFDVTNPLGVPLTASVLLTPKIDGTFVPANAVKVDNIRIAAATREEGMTAEEGRTHVVIARADRRNDFADAETQFKEADITRLFKGRIPQQIRIELEIASDTSEEYTVYVVDDYSVEYGYSVDIPLDFGDKFALSYSDTATGLADTFSELTDKSISIGDITIIASIENSTPLDLKVSAELLDFDGNPTEAQAVVDANNDTAYGSGDGKVRTSEIRIALNLGKDNSIKSLEEVDGARFTLKALSPKSGARLNKNQTLSAKLKLNIKGGITADLNELSEDETEEE